MRKTLATTVAVLVAAGHAQAASDCVGPQDELAMKTSSMQQALMVAALSCGDISPYNHFVLSHQAELQQADAALLAFFVRENAEAGQDDYHAFKTKAANVSSLASARDNGAYCANAARLFQAAFEPYGANLAWFVSSQWQTTNEVIRASCTVDEAAARISATPSRSYGGPVPPSPVEPSLANGNPD
jgi:hypothetical protein